MIRSIHPFPARMAPELALEKLIELDDASLVLDPMAGSGTVLRQATALGHQAVGFDMDPLAVLMTSVWTTAVDDRLVDDVAERVRKRIAEVDAADIALKWMDEDPETNAFVDFWFAEPQKSDLRQIAFVLDEFQHSVSDPQERVAVDLLRIALSRLIITKDKGASLARDVSHSRPHRVGVSNDFDVHPMFARSIRAVRKRLKDAPPSSGATIELGDARKLDGLADASVDAVLTSPPYLNAIDYMRGHRLSLVWLGHKLGDLRTIRSTSIGAERAPDRIDEAEVFDAMRAAMGRIDELPRKYGSMIHRYIQDIWHMVSEIARVLKNGASATFVMGNSCLRDVFIRNSEAVATAATFAGLTRISETERPLPVHSRYLPMTSAPLGKRMRTETILTFARE
ncbi:hypothetical protein ASD67_17680 [Sphingopyxis sp. Root1497]|uniref:hypothetical protein n=1 Tax=Sphingopyxis sp. Root1497 TaxID=1736474 RepID=UPI0006F5D3AD|nr:hypothetical protein [Sphingopyxis sp. Root1497]KQZ61976.1 hypothetical protein ASD67_17680 [Sphingopyxis sp. Root1497]